MQLAPVPIFKRPRPLPRPPRPLRPIYREEARTLRRRAHWPADMTAAMAALAVMEAAIDQRSSPAFQSDALHAAIALLRPYVHQAVMLDEFWEAGLKDEESIGRGRLDHPLNGVLRQLGLPQR